MAGHPLDYQAFPDVNPTGAPSDFEHIQSSPEAFGGAIAGAEQKLGAGVTQAADVSLQAMTARQELNNTIHNTELSTHLNNNLTQSYSDFTKINGRAAQEQLPIYQQKNEEAYHQVEGQITSLSQRAEFARQARYQIDQYNKLLTFHADSQYKTWYNKTKQEQLDSYGDSAALLELHGDRAGMLQNLDKGVTAAKEAALENGLDPEWESKKYFGSQMAKIIKEKARAGGEGGAPDPQGAAALYSQYQNQIDTGNRLQVESVLHPAIYSAVKEGYVNLSTGQPVQQQFFTDAEKGNGLPVGLISRSFQIEGGGKLNAPQTGKYRGISQFGPVEEARYGINDSNRTDLVAQTRALITESLENKAALTKAIGHDPSAADYYLAHQQGLGGALAHIQNPDQPAWQSMASTAEGRSKGEGWAKQAIWGNIPDRPQDSPMFNKTMFPGGVETVTSADFRRGWANKFNSSGGGMPIGEDEAVRNAQSYIQNNPILLSSVISGIKKQYSDFRIANDTEIKSTRQQSSDLIDQAADGVQGLEFPIDRVKTYLPPYEANKLQTEFEIANHVGELTRSLKWEDQSAIDKARLDIDTGHGVLSDAIKTYAHAASSGPGVSGADADAELTYAKFRKVLMNKFETAQNKRNEAIFGPHADPATYIQSNPIVAAHEQAFHANPTPEAFNEFAMASLTAQEHMGLSADQQHLMTRENAEKFVNKLKTNSDAKTQIEQMQANAGKYWPTVLRDLVTLGGMPAGYQAVAALDNPNDAALLSRWYGSFTGQKGGEIKTSNQYAEERIGTAALHTIKENIRGNGAVGSLFQSMAKSGSSPQQIEAFKDAIDNLAYAKKIYENDATPEASAIKAFTDRYNFDLPGGARVPTTIYNDMSNKTTEAINNVDEKNIIVPSKSFGGEYQPSKAEYIALLRSSPTWVTSQHEDGVLLFDKWGGPVKNSETGKQIFVPFKGASTSAPPPQPQLSYPNP